MYWLFLIIVIFISYFAIEGIVEWDAFKFGMCFIILLILAIIFRGYDGYKNTGVWFG